MAQPVLAGRDVSAGTYQCTKCGEAIDIGLIDHLPTCPTCGNSEWEPQMAVEAVEDSYPAA